MIVNKFAIDVLSKSLLSNNIGKSKKRCAWISSALVVGSGCFFSLTTHLLKDYEY